MTHVSPRDALDPYRSCNSSRRLVSQRRRKDKCTRLFSAILKHKARRRVECRFYTSSTLRLLLLKLNRKHWNVPARRRQGGEPEDQLSVPSTRPRRTCAWRECTPVRRIDARKMSIVSRRHHRAHPRARSSSSTDRSFGRSTLRAPVAPPSLSRFSRAPVRPRPRARVDPREYRVARRRARPDVRRRRMRRTWCVSREVRVFV